MVLIRHDKTFYSLHFKSMSDASMEEGLYIKCIQYGIQEIELDIALEEMYINNHNAAHFGNNNRFIYSYELGKL